ncbi:alkaline phytoceramidase [Schizopora paradoxa]|uniref:Alkaline phytoceramidase n=1 Tax=Schizopora paradoxa TaxID=27342 RepID=A0A0H2R6W5_9AGAM|nr:alkaline phytoceramidase [Schizopora paradoxa]
MKPHNITDKFYDGIWGPVTSTLDWCEANYQFSRYIAEMANSVSNLFSIAIALYGAKNAQDQGFPFAFVVGFLAFAIVGVGSFAFHATLLYTAQLADELPMIFSVSCSLFLVFDSVPGFKMTARTWTVLLTLVTFNVFFSWTYWLYRNPIYHQFVFGSLMLINTGRSVWLTSYSKYSDRLGSQKRSEILSCFGWGAAWFLSGFFIWNLDNIFCSTITGWKKQLGWPAAFLLEGHSWWHLLTGVGSYLMWMGTTCTTLCVKDDPKRYKMVYDFGWSPRVAAVKKIKA